MTNFLGLLLHPAVTVVTAITALALLTTWLTTAARADYRADVVEAARVSGWGTESIAAQTQTARSRLSQQLNGHAPCSFLGRVPDLSPDFERAWIKLRAKRHGLVVVDVTELQHLVRAVMALVGKRVAKKMEMERSA